MLEAEEDKQAIVGIGCEDFPNICRTCLRKGDLIDIFSSFVEQENIEMDRLLKLCIKLEASEDDRLPNNICTVCANKLLDIYMFRKRCLLNDSLLRVLEAAAPVGCKPESDGEDKEMFIIERVFKSEIDSTEDVSDDGKEFFIVENNLDEDLDSNEDPSDDAQDFFNVENDSNEDQESKGDASNDEEDILITKNDLDNIELIEEQDEENLHSLENLQEIKPPLEVKRERKIFPRTRVRNLCESQSLSYFYRCRRCKQIFNNFEECKIHRDEQGHPEINKMYVCNICHIPKSSIVDHMRTHTKEKPFKCERCDKVFTLQSNLRRHIRIRHHGEKKHVCEICGKTFTQKSSLKSHNHNVHATKEPSEILCSDCGRTFHSFGAFRSHQKKHHGPKPDPADPHLDTKTKHKEEKPYRCEVCDKHFKIKQLLEQHKIVVHSDKSFFCIHCRKAFSTKGALTIHLRKHTGEKPYKCTTCFKSFRLQNSLKSHMRVHTGDRPYSCGVCDKKFTQWTHWNIHRRTHDGTRPYVCNFCDKSFAMKGNLTVHMRMHTGERPYTCEVCGKAFPDSSSRNKHQQRHDS